MITIRTIAIIAPAMIPMTRKVPGAAASVAM